MIKRIFAVEIFYKEVWRKVSDLIKFWDLDHGQGVLYIVAAILVSVAIIKALAYIGEKFGIKTKTMIRDEMQDKDIALLKEQQDKVFQDLDDIKNLVTVLSTSITDMSAAAERKEMKRVRREILNFSDRLRSGSAPSKESIDDILEMYDDYEKYIRDHKLTNGRMNMAIAYINDYYQAHFYES